MAAFGMEWSFYAAYCWLFFVVFLPNQTEGISVANCSLSGCLHGGTCMQMPTSDIFSCLCLPDWTGDLCTTKVQYGPGCSSNPCSNGGTCQNFIDHYVCLCDFFWRGKHCETFRGFEDAPPITAPCSLQEYRCDDGRCVIQRYICDGTEDCVDGSDEKYCGSVMPVTECVEWQFDCGEGNCIPKERRCNGIKDCTNGGDEYNCDASATPRIAEDQPPGTPLQPVEPSLNLIDIFIVSCAMLMTFMAITIFVYVRRVRRMQQRYFAAVGHPHHLHHHHHHHSSRRRRRNRLRRNADGNDDGIDAVTTPYRLTQHSNFCHHLPPHRCPARTNLLVSYNLNNGVHIPHMINTSDKEEEVDDNEVPPTYLEVVGAGITASGIVQMQGDETPPPAYEDLHVEVL